MKAITLYQPYASLVACGAKKNETRSWHTWYTGPLAIHAAKTETYLFFATAPGRFRSALLEAGVDADNLPTGAVVATCNLRACVQIVNQSIIDGLALTEDEIHFGDWTFDRYAWVLDDVRMLAKPSVAQGHQRIWNWDPIGGVGGVQFAQALAARIDPLTDAEKRGALDAADAVWDPVTEINPEFMIVEGEVIDLRDESDG